MDCTVLMAVDKIAGSSANGMPAFTSNIVAPASTCATASASTLLKSPSVISVASNLRPVGLMRSPITQNGWSKPIVTSFDAEHNLVRVMAITFYKNR